MAARKQGRVVRWKHTFGFIQPTDRPGPDVFVSYHAIEGNGYRSLEEGQHVSFEMGADPQGRTCAVAVRVEPQ